MNRKIQALKYILGSKTEWVKAWWKYWDWSFSPSGKEIGKKHEAVRICLDQCSDRDLEILKAEMGQRKLGVQHSMGFTILYSAVAIDLMNEMNDIFGVWEGLLYCFAILTVVMLVYVIGMRLINEPMEKRATYISDVIDLIEQERKEKKAPTGGSIYTVTVKKES